MAEFVGLTIALLDVSIRAVSRTTSFVIKLLEAGETCRKLAEKVSSLGQLLTRLLSLAHEYPAGSSEESCVIQLIIHEKYLERCGSILNSVHQLFDKYDPGTSPDAVRLWKQLHAAKVAAKLQAHVTDLEDVYSRLKDALSLDTTHTINMVQNHLQQINKRSLEAEHAGLLDWIAPLDVSYEANLKTVLAQTKTGTAEWIFTTPEYKRWKAEGGPLLLHGFAGAGKSVLTANVASHLRGGLDSSENIVLHYFFRAIDTYRMNVDGLQHSFIQELLRRDTSGYRHIRRLRDSTHDPVDEDYLDLISELIPQDRAVFMVIDGADDTECSELDRLVSFVTSVNQRHPKVRLFLSGRIVAPWMKLSGLQSMDMSESLPDTDLRRYAENRIASMDMNDCLTRSSREQLVNQIVMKARKLFIYAKMALDYLSSIRRVGEAVCAAERLPPVCDSNVFELCRTVLEDVLSKHPEDKREEVMSTLKHMFMIMCQGNYCLPVPEFASFISIRDDQTCFEPGDRIMNPEKDCASYLGQLLCVDSSVTPNEMNIMHTVFEDYVQSEHLRNDPLLGELYVSRIEAQRYMAVMCARICGFTNFSKPLRELTLEENEFKGHDGGIFLTNEVSNPWVAAMHDRCASVPGYEYASIHLLEHAREAMFSPEEFRSILLPHLRWFTDRDKEGQLDNRYRSWQEVHAHFCSRLDCQCRSWQPPEYFARRYNVGVILDHINQSRRAAAVVDAEEQASATRPTSNGKRKADDDIPNGGKRPRGDSDESRCRPRVPCSSGCGNLVPYSGGSELLRQKLEQAEMRQVSHETNGLRVVCRTCLHKPRHRRKFDPTTRVDDVRAARARHSSQPGNQHP